MKATTAANRGSVTPTKTILSKYPAYGKVLADRMKWNNLPMFIFVCVGGDAFRAAQEHNKDRDFSAMVLTADKDPKAFIWPVAGCPVVIRWDGSAAAALIIELVKCLLRSGATSATVWPIWEDCTTPTGYYDSTKSPLKFIQTREIIKTYHSKAVQA